MVELNELQKEAVEKVTENDALGLQALLASSKLDISFSDPNGMNLLQHAAYKGNKDVVQILLDQGADANDTQHEHNYTALHFAALSGKEEVCALLLKYGAKSQALNSVNRTPAQMAAFVGNHNCVAAINNFVPLSDVQYFIVPNGLDQEPKLQPVLAEPFHRFITQVNLHPVAVLMYLQKNSALVPHLKQVRTVLELMSEREMKRGPTTNEVLSFKFHWLGSILDVITDTDAAKTDKTKDKDTLDMCLRQLTKPSFLDQLVKGSVRTFPFVESTMLRQIASSVASFTKEKDYEAGGLIAVITSSINGHRGFASSSQCSACGNEKAALQCSRCKSEVYCGPECQRVHWHVHKKTCSPSKSSSGVSEAKVKDEDKALLAEMVQQLGSQSLEVN